jgi:hypothetical protein
MDDTVLVDTCKEDGAIVTNSISEEFEVKFMMVELDVALLPIM